jgi:pimeloyl-ACP methyl ester carboxylesterase
MAHAAISDGSTVIRVPGGEIRPAPATALHPLSGRLGVPDGTPKGTLVLLPGGGMRAAYWDWRPGGAGSMLRAAVGRGWMAYALDRPGYGDSVHLADHRPSARSQEALVRSAVEHVAPSGPVVIGAHSLGSIVGVHCAVDGWDGRIAGLTIGGVPLAYTPDQRESFGANDRSGPFIRMPRQVRELSYPRWFGPDGSYDPAITEHFSTLMARTPSGEFEDAWEAPDVLPSLLAEVAVPVQLAVGEHEASTAPKEQILGVARQALAARDDAELLVVPGAGHNLSLSFAAEEYHRSMLDFAERVLPGDPS